MKKNATLLLSLLMVSVTVLVVEPDLAPREWSGWLSLSPPSLEEPPQNTVSKIPKKDRIDLAIAQEVEMTQDPSLGIVPKERLTASYAFAQRKMVRPGVGRTAISNVVWEERGPNNVAGRTRAIMVDQNDPTHETLWAAGVAGGLWKCSNISAPTPTWVPQDDFFDNMAITTLAQDPTNFDVMYFGTGEGWFNADAVRGLGIWKSTDGGTNWTQLSSTNNSTFHYVQKIVIDASGNLYAATRDNGLMKSTDGGNSWFNVLGTGFRAADVEIAANGDVYASLGIFSAGSLHRSTNGGSTWTQFGVTQGFPTTGYNRVEIACAPSDANRVYVLLHSQSSNSCYGIYRTDNAGTNWTSLPVPPAYGMSDFTRGQAWYDLIAGVDPSNADRVFIGGIDLLLSEDGGNNWAQVTQWFGGGGFPYMHADQHIITFEPGNPDVAYFGNDGGVYRTANATASAASININSRNTGYNVTQYYAAAVSPTPGLTDIIAGSQDNGTQRYQADGMNATVEVSGGDGAFCHIDEDDESLHISSYVYNNYFISSEAWQNSIRYFLGNSGRFINPTDFDSDNNRLYACSSGGQYLRIDNVGQSGMNPQAVNVPAFGGNMVSAVSVSPNVPNQVFFATSGGRVVRVDNAHTNSPTATLINGGAGMSTTGYISSVAVEDGDNDHLLVTYSNYGLSSSIWETTNGGATWTNKEGNLPDMPVRWALFHPYDANQVLIATELGVWSTTDISATSVDWDPTNIGLANVRVDMLQLRSSDNLLVAATHGRGLYTSTVFQRPQVSFQREASTVAEADANLNSGCQDYQDVDVTVVIYDAPTGDADLNLNLGGTATSGSDYELLTVGPVTFPDGGTANQTVSLRIFDDNEEEPDETIELSYAISGATDVVAGSVTQTHTLTIKSEDVMARQSQAVLLSEDFEGSTSSWSTTISAFSPPYNFWGFGSFGCSQEIDNGTAAIWGYDGTSTYCDYINTATSEAYLYHTIDATGYVDLSVTFDWVAQGEELFDFGKLVYSTDGGINWDELGPDLVISRFRTTTTVDLPASLSNTTFDLGWRWINDNTIGEGPGLGIDNIEVTGRAYVPLAVDLNDNDQVYLGPLAEINLYEAGSLIATLKNNSSHDFGCTTVEIDRAGAGTQDFWYSGDATKALATKTIMVTPTNNDPNASVSVTLYYTQAEVSGWESNTGKAFLTDAKVVKNGGNISNVTPAMPFPDGNSIEQGKDNAISIPENGGYAITATFTTGFSGFGMGDPGTAPTTFPAEFLSFTATAAGPNEVDLTWTVGEEVNLASYLVERARPDGEFEVVGEVAAAQQSQYRFSDPNLTPGRYLYRLRTVDYDGTEDFSDLRNVTLDAAQLWQAYPNPLTNQLYVQLPPESQGRTIQLTLTTLKGHIAWQYRGEGSTTPISLDLSGLSLARGTYQLKAVVDGVGTQVFNLQKQ